MASQRGRKGQVNAAPKAFDANIPEETRVETASGGRSSARLRNKTVGLDASKPPSPPKNPAVPAQRKPPQAKTKLSKVVSQGANKDDIQQKLGDSDRSANQPPVHQIAAELPKKKQDKQNLADQLILKRLISDMNALDSVVRDTISKVNSVGVEEKCAIGMSTKSQRAANADQSRGQIEDDDDYVSSSDSPESSSDGSDASIEEDEDAAVLEPFIGRLDPGHGSRRRRRVRIVIPGNEARQQPSRVAVPGEESGRSTIIFPSSVQQQINSASLAAYRETHKDRQDRPVWSPYPGMPTSPDSFSVAQLASKRAFWWAHVLWIIACFLIALLLWTLALSLYWGNYFATVGPPAPCDMTISSRPFPQTYAESFKIFRRPDVSWDPIVRKQMEDFGSYVGADPWLMDNCILPRNVMKLPLVTCQERLPWYNLTEIQVLWLNENNNWAFNLDLELTEKFNKVFDMQFELQELQVSWMLSDHGPTSIDYGSRRCQACNDLLAKEKSQEEKPTRWWQLRNSKKPQNQQPPLTEQLPNLGAFEELRKALEAEENPPIPLVTFVERDEPYWKRAGSVGPDLMYTEADGSSWQPSDGAYTAMRTA